MKSLKDIAQPSYICYICGQPRKTVDYVGLPCEKCQETTWFKWKILFAPNCRVTTCKNNLVKRLRYETKHICVLEYSEKKNELIYNRRNCPHYEQSRDARLLKKWKVI